MKRAMIGLALVAVLGVIPVASVSAKAQQPLNFKMELTLFAEDCAVPHTPPFLTWAGTVVIDGTTYGWADFPTGPFVVEGNFGSFEEYWTIFTLDEDEAVTPANACDVSRVVLAGTNDGWGSVTAGTGFADGEVTFVDDEGALAEVALGSRMFWRGKVIGDTGTEFRATLHILRPK